MASQRLEVLSATRITAGVLCGMGAGALWGFVFLAPELIRAFSPLTLTIARYLAYGGISALLLAPRWHDVLTRLSRREWLGLARLGLVGNLLYYILLSLAVQNCGIAMTSLVMGFLPVVVTVAGSREHGALPLRRLAPSLALCGGSAICIGQQALATRATGGADHNLTGLLCAVGALVSWAWYGVTNSRWLSRLPHVTAHDWSLLTGIATGALTLALVPVAAMVDKADHASPDWFRLVGTSAGLALSASIVGNMLWNRMSRLLPLTLVGQMILFETLFALLYAFVWERRLPTWLEAAAFAFVSLSVVSCVAAHARNSAKGDRDGSERGDPAKLTGTLKKCSETR